MNTVQALTSKQRSDGSWHTTALAQAVVRGLQKDALRRIPAEDVNSDESEHESLRQFLTSSLHLNRNSTTMN